MSDKPLIVCWFGIYDPTYSRNVSLIDGLRAAGAEVVECNARGGGLRKYLTLIRQLRSLQGQYDVVYCAFPVYASIFLAYFLQRQPIVVDAFFPKYDAAVNDRKTHTAYHPIAWWFYFLDWAMLKLATHVVTDTEVHKRYWQRWRQAADISVIPVGVHTGEFYPIPTSRKNNNFLVQFHGSYIPLQGVDRIIRAINLLKHRKDITFRFIGKGQTYADSINLIRELGVEIELIPWLSIEDLNLHLNEADLILGIFGDTDKADRVVPNKVYQGLAVAKPVLTKDTPAIREHLEEESAFLCSNDPKDIADAIERIVDDREKSRKVAATGYNLLASQFTHEKLGSRLLDVLKEIV